jgi:K+-transporting ATPase c subunit
VIGQTLFRDKANGSLIVDSTGTVRGFFGIDADGRHRIEVPHGR